MLLHSLLPCTSLGLVLVPITAVGILCFSLLSFLALHYDQSWCRLQLLVSYASPFSPSLHFIRTSPGGDYSCWYIMLLPSLLPPTSLGPVLVAITAVGILCFSLLPSFHFIRTSPGADYSCWYLMLLPSLLPCTSLGPVLVAITAVGILCFSLLSFLALH